MKQVGRTADQNGRDAGVLPADSVGIIGGRGVDVSRAAVAVQQMVKHQITSNPTLQIRLAQKAAMRNNEVYMSD